MFETMSVIAMLIGASVAGLISVAYIWQIRRQHHYEIRHMYMVIEKLRKEVEELKAGASPQHN